MGGTTCRRARAHEPPGAAAVDCPRCAWRSRAVPATKAPTTSAQPTVKDTMPVPAVLVATTWATVDTAAWETLLRVAREPHAKQAEVSIVTPVVTVRVRHIQARLGTCMLLALVVERVLGGLPAPVPVFTWNSAKGQFRNGFAETKTDDFLRGTAQSRASDDRTSHVPPSFSHVECFQFLR